MPTRANAKFVPFARAFIVCLLACFKYVFLLAVLCIELYSLVKSLSVSLYLCVTVLVERMKYRLVNNVISVLFVVKMMGLRWAFPIFFPPAGKSLGDFCCQCHTFVHGCMCGVSVNGELSNLYLCHYKCQRCISLFDILITPVTTSVACSSSALIISCLMKF